MESAPAISGWVRDQGERGLERPVPMIWSGPGQWAVVGKPNDVGLHARECNPSGPTNAGLFRLS